MKWNKADFLPPGESLEGSGRCLFGLVGIALVWNLTTFVLRFSGELSQLYVNRNGVKTLVQGARMPDMETLIQGSLIVVWFFPALAIVVAASYYASFRRDSKSIYLMKRLEDPWELHRRCLTVPGLILLTGVATMAALLALDWALYRFIPPKACLGAAHINIWRALVW